MVIAFVFATTKVGKEREALDEIIKLGEVVEAHNVYGDYDLVLKTETGSVDELNEFLITKLRNVESIAMTTTMISL